MTDDALTLAPERAPLARAKLRRIASAIALRLVASSRPGSAIIVSRPQSLNHG